MRSPDSLSVVARRRLAVMLVVTTLGAAACTSTSAVDAGSRSPSRSPSRSASRSPRPSKSESPSPSPAAIEDGRHFVFLKKIDQLEDGSSQLTFDLAYFLTGDEAVKAAIADGVIKHGEPLPNDYYIVNDNPKLRTVPFAPEVVVRVIDWKQCCDLVPGDFAPFVEAVNSGSAKGSYHGVTSPYWIRVKGGVIVKIEEQYLP
jgi:hypothetical protein